MENQKLDNQPSKVAKRKISLGTWLLVSVSLLILSSILVVQLLYDNGVIASNRFYDNTSINGVDVTGMNRNEVADMISDKLLSD
jgi:hypothetical protein